MHLSISPGRSVYNRNLSIAYPQSFLLCQDFGLSTLREGSVAGSVPKGKTSESSVGKHSHSQRTRKTYGKEEPKSNLLMFPVGSPHTLQLFFALYYIYIYTVIYVYVYIFC